MGTILTLIQKAQEPIKDNFIINIHEAKEVLKNEEKRFWNRLTYFKNKYKDIVPSKFLKKDKDIVFINKLKGVYKEKTIIQMNKPKANLSRQLSFFQKNIRKDAV